MTRLGAYLPADLHGFLPARPANSVIVEPWSAAVRALVGGYLDEWGSSVHSVYVRGSVARNLAVPGLADWSAAIDRELRAQFPFLSGVEVDLLPVETVLDRRNPYAFILKSEAACVHGEDLSERLERFHLSEVNFQTRYFSDHLEEFLTEYPLEPDEGRPGFVAWLAKRFLRLGMELVMERERCYTRDLYLCYESFAVHYPEEGASMYRVLGLAIHPVPNDETIVFLREFGAWLTGLARDSLGRPH